MKINYRIPSVDTAFSLDKDYKKRYNETDILRKNKDRDKWSSKTHTI